MADPYDNSEHALYRHVTIEELDALLRAGGRPVARDSSKVVHLLTRTRATLAAHLESIEGMHRTIAEVNNHVSRAGTATTLNPLDALKYLDDEQRELLFDRIARERLAMLRHMVSQAETAHTELTGQLEQVRAAAESVTQRADLPADVRADFARLLAYLPSEIRPVSRPPLLDYPDPDPVGDIPGTGAAHAMPGPRPRVPGPPPGANAAPMAPAGHPAATSPGPVPEHGPGHPGPPPATPGDVNTSAGTSVDDTATYVDPWAADGAETPAYTDPWGRDEPEVPAYTDPWGRDEPRTPSDPGPGTSPAPPSPRDPAPPAHPQTGGLDTLFT